MLCGKIGVGSEGDRCQPTPRGLLFFRAATMRPSANPATRCPGVLLLPLPRFPRRTSSLGRLLKRHPLAVSVAIATAKTSFADGIVQTAAEGRSFAEIDWRRNAVFGAFGCGYLGFALYAIKVKGFQRLFPGVEAFCNLSFRAKLRDRAGLRALASQVVLDVAVLNPLIYWPTFYCFKSLCFRDPRDARPTLAVLREALTGYAVTALDDNAGMARFWLPLNLLIYSVPLHLRMPMNHVASLVWCCILSLSQGSSISMDAMAAGGART